MSTLREKYHSIGNKLNKASMSGGAVKELAKMITGEENREIAEKLIARGEAVEKAVAEGDREIQEIKDIAYRMADPDIDLTALYQQITDENQRYRIFLVEDEDEVCEVFKMVMERKGFTFGFALNGEDAMAKLRDFEPHFVFLDFHLPGGKTGLDVLQFIRRELPGVQCLVITRDDNPEVHKEVESVGVEGILIKPLTMVQVNAKLSGLIARLKR